ncbi:ABC transporter permease [Listeria sp. PSOL-1]|uniref:ABC transporter permease n=1 Tax=Listeria sp. PSOL-1 TaxID=1844999 RepID=UPI0013D4C265|nr:ABC transporter permease [Listeria sp. PSOL-1]
MKLNFNSNELWKKRYSHYTDELVKYLRYMFNDHLLLVLLIGIGALIFYYADWVKTLKPGFPGIPLMVVLLTVAICAGQIVTLLKRADSVYLIVQEKGMAPYFRKAQVASFWLQSYSFVIILGAAMPMYTAITGYSYSRFFGLLVALILIKCWNVGFSFQALKLDNSDTAWLYFRVILSALLIYLVLAFHLLWTIPITIVVLLVSYAAILQRTKDVTLRFELLIVKEEARMNRFYRLVNLFTDVPHLKGTVKRRAYLDFLYKPIPYAKRKTFAFLWSRTFVRTNEYIGLYVRLTVICAILIIFIQGLYLNLLFSLLFLYLTGFQFIPMLKHFDGQLMMKLYPVEPKIERRSFVHFIRILLVGQAVLFSIIEIAENGSIGGMLCLAINLLFVVIFTFIYIPYRMKKMYQ